MTPPLKIRIKKMADGSAALTCTRADGTQTWQRQNGILGTVFPGHDLTHYAVESVLGYTHGFYGLLATGWEISDFATPWPRGDIPTEAREVEFVVGMFDMERRVGEPFSSADFADVGGRYATSSSRHAPIVPPPLTDAQLDQVRKVRAELLKRWAGVKPGEALELTFQVPE